MVKPSAHASHILVKSKGEATQLASNITKLKDFQKTARKKSDCPSSQRGGDLGWFSAEDMVESFSKAIKKLVVGELTDYPVQSQFGWR